MRRGTSLIVVERVGQRIEERALLLFVLFRLRLGLWIRIRLLRFRRIGHFRRLRGTLRRATDGRVGLRDRFRRRARFRRGSRGNRRRRHPHGRRNGHTVRWLGQPLNPWTDDRRGRCHTGCFLRDDSCGGRLEVAGHRLRVARRGARYIMGSRDPRRRDSRSWRDAGSGNRSGSGRGMQLGRGGRMSVRNVRVVRGRQRRCGRGDGRCRLLNAAIAT